MSDRFYIGLVHKDPDSSYGISFPDVPGVISAEDTFEAVLREGAVALDFALEDWPGGPPAPRTIEQLRQDPEFREWAEGAIIVAVRPNAFVYQAAQ
ncbi:MAG: HicB family protein [Devosia sp. 67-54]|uniref:type II toxin-antitoxin system HicB family antitoxin n=1 Tax=unclassified Devosia TaxID=196773 RepID=UPI000964E285|nr:MULTISPECIES: type II toxin-antitoxin system HicB family antitoxin [unclassified Devosia]MBN9305035.1 type II toxin-antitoxin system HicB family antitoxin [Devosia sp.]OJX15023.1 MAG: HicB family protein [Devosia sp. 67-54]